MHPVFSTSPLPIAPSLLVDLRLCTMLSSPTVILQPYGLPVYPQGYPSLVQFRMRHEESHEQNLLANCLMICVCDHKTNSLPVH
ncbi:hypothetical protein DPEC_G00143140 [Dallia pectoralis]|uniref:Uncharacterized protein n=1 Tax=Dallia pectoralis TaxID=75939 RepID=A0ACC2GMZ3_DALPE|nr:hypothetical protein DPEC_G00143140 [Dallia pectoralis]